MKNLIPILLALLSIPRVFAAPPPDIQARLDTWIKGQPGGIAVAWVDRDGATFFQSGHYASDDPRPITPDTQFEIGSVTKVFTALLLAESERRGKVSRHDPAAKYLLPADDPAQAALAKITLLSLTTHTSGLPRLPANIGKNPDASTDPYAAYGRAALVEGLRLHGPSTTVGRSVAYSNFGVSVLGEALGAAWGASYAEALRAQVLAPLGMNVTTVGLAGQPPPADLAPGHADGKRVPNWTFLACAAAGGIRSSTRDLARLLAACLGGPDAPLHAALNTTQQPQHANADTGGHIGLGWMLTDDAERPIVWHNGATAGSHAFVGFCPKTGVGIALLANVHKGSEKLGFELLGGKQTRPNTAVANAADYSGRYPLSPAFSIAITEANGSLFAQATGQSKLALRPVSADRFAIVGVAAEISFERNAEGKVIALVLHQNGRDQRGLRGELPPPPKEIALPAETLAGYAGDYPLTPAFVLTVSVERGAVFVQATGQSKLPVFASARDEFFYKAVDARITFQRDAAGQVSGLTLHQNGKVMPATKR
ncbi:MAG: serine hydrolase [Opitutae bacterium]|nr:serine hydrolase [Opitutae bacterium]